MSIPTNLDKPHPDHPARTVARSADGFTVLDTCHRQTLEMARALCRLAALVSDGHVDAEARRTAAEIHRFFCGSARLHHEDEERHVFPMLVNQGRPDVVQAVLRLQQDHGWLEEDWLELAPQVQALAAGHVGVDADLLREGAAVLEALYQDHIALEESFIYPEARAGTASATREEMGREMAARRRERRRAA